MSSFSSVDLWHRLHARQITNEVDLDQSREPTSVAAFKQCNYWI